MFFLSDIISKLSVTIQITCCQPEIISKEEEEIKVFQSGIILSVTFYLTFTMVARLIKAAGLIGDYGFTTLISCFDSNVKRPLKKST